MYCTAAMGGVCSHLRHIVLEERVDSFQVLNGQVKEGGAPVLRHLHRRTTDMVCLAEGNACNPRCNLTLAITLELLASKGGLIYPVSCENTGCSAFLHAVWRGHPRTLPEANMSK